jgi:hypothetical protein
LLLIDTINNIETIILKCLSFSDRDILGIYVSKQLQEATNEKVKDGLSKILKSINKGWTDFEHSPQCLSVKYFEKNIFTLTSFQYRVAFHFETWQEIANIFQDKIYPNIPNDKYLLFLVKKIENNFCDILWRGINFQGHSNDDSYYETHKREYENLIDIHKEFVKRDCELLRDLFLELL